MPKHLTVASPTADFPAPSASGITITASGMVSSAIPNFSILPARNIIIGNTVIPASGVWVDGLPSTLTNYSSGSVSISGVTGIHGNLSVSTQQNTLLTSFGMPDLKYVSGNVTIGSSSTGLSSLDFSSLVAVSGTLLTNSYCPSLSLPELIYCSNFSPNTSGQSGFTISIPKLAVVDTLNINNNTTLITFSAPSLAVCGSLSIAGTFTHQLQTISLPALSHVFYGGIGISPVGSSIANVTLPTNGTLKFVNGNVTCTGKALTAASVENILVALATLDGTNGTTVWGSGKTVNLSGGTSSGVSALTGPAATARSTLLARSATVTLNA